MKLYYKPLLGITILLLNLLIGCSPKIHESGFLDDYSKLTKGDANSTMLSYVNPDLKRGKYKKLMIDDIVISFHPKAKSTKINLEKLQELKEYFKTEIIKNLEPEYELVDQPGSDVALIQIAITDIRPGKIWTNVFPFMIAVNTATGRGKGGASLELQVVDSVTKEILGQAIDNRKNRGYIETFSKYGNARAVMSYWAKLLRKRIDHFRNNQPTE
ncbi:DUF3313 domain-containing protein [Aquimarina sp. 2201CG5-10]|uniref:DUF3313 domain-containing protein n=1 Tax=Aquimarina callyspongiae TaxID=3098150 RepID=UPI002AB37ABE|nr:DUF3313 domain-containing protein [Aquimarina sp. 2201CG5-10]MDY8135963.1 DUF3313 domain-containing protein [Aquimarina sp. 2201CG5-10]